MAAVQPDLENLLPHRGPTRLLEAVEEILEDRLVCRARIPANNPFASEGSAPAFVGLEIAAQAAAAVEALARLKSEGAVSPRIGYLVGVRDAVFHAEVLPVDRPLRVSVRLAKRTGPLNVYEAVVTLEGESRVEATISTTIP
jgi:predicted hotdog family 3-hydroxylacyl-ACP dehydratase